MNTPGTNPTSVNQSPLGPHWQHTYLSWVYAFGSGGTNYVTWHNGQGRDVLFTYCSTCTGSSGWNYYTPQYTDHVISLAQNTASPYQVQVQLLTGETLYYNSSGQLTQIWDTENPTPNVVNITWDSTTNGNVSTVTDASGGHRLLFTYVNGFMRTMQYQLNESGTWTTEHTTTYEYASNVTMDATSFWYTPASSTEWTTLLSGTGISNPSHLYSFQQSSGNVSDVIGTATMTAGGTGSSSLTYQSAVTGWSRYGIKWTDNLAAYFSNGVSSNSNSVAMLVLASMDSTPSASRTPWYQGANVTLTSTPIFQVADNSTANGVDNPIGSVQAYLLRNSQSLQLTSMTDNQETITPTWANVNNGTYIGGAVNNAPAMHVLYAAQWTGSPADLTATQAQTLVKLMENGTGYLSSVTIGSQLAQQYTYGSGYLTNIADGSGNLIASFAYSSTTNGEVNQVNTPHGTVGLDYASSRASCSGETLLYFNAAQLAANPGVQVSCGSDADCSSEGGFCGGKTSSTGSSGLCFQAGRCLTTSTVGNEYVVTNVWPVGSGGSGSSNCTGACADVSQYVWTTPSMSNPVIAVSALADGTGSDFTVKSFNTNGLPTEIEYGATNSSGSSPNRTEYLTYDTLFPGRIATSSRQSDLSTSTCTGGSGSACDFTEYTYNEGAGSDHQLYQVTHIGNTYNSSGSATQLTSTVTYSHDSYARTTEIQGAVSGIKTLFNYYSSSDPTLNGYLENYQLYTTSSAYLEPQILTYDIWGHPTSTEAPDGNLTCDTYDSSRGYLTQRRHAMTGQTSCTGSNSADIITSYTRDSYLRLTQLQRPDGGCVLYSYNASGQLSQINRADNCAAGSGDYQQYKYTADGQISYVYTYSSGAVLTAAQPYTYDQGRQVAEVVNPVNTFYYTGFSYDQAARVTTVGQGSGTIGGSTWTSLGETAYNYSGSAGRDSRVTSINQYYASGSDNTWSPAYSWLGNQASVTNPDSTIFGTTRDDFSQVVESSSPDVTYPTLYNYDAAGRMTSETELFGSGSAVTHSFTYDYAGRQTVADYLPRCPTGTTHPLIQRSFDALPSGVSCPSAMHNACTNITGRLAYVEVALMCSSTYADGSLDQDTYYAYDDAGRVIEEYITDDTGRTADTQYQYTKDGTQSQITLPSTATVGWTYGLSGSDSSADLVSAMSRSGTTMIDTVEWDPFGPLAQYNQEDEDDESAKYVTTIARNLAYRATSMQMASTYNTAYQLTLTEDDKGRVSSRQYGDVTGMGSSYFLYDNMDRVTCETTDSKSTCPGSGSDIKNNMSGSPTFTSTGDWVQLTSPWWGTPTLPTNTFTFSLGSGTHQITQVAGSGNISTDTEYLYNAFGQRSEDYIESGFSYGTRTYTYDSRHNVINIRGQYYTGTAWDYYDVASAFDAKNRRVYKSFYDETTKAIATWYFYYDSTDRLTEVSYRPSSTVLQIYQLLWLGQRMIGYYETSEVGRLAPAKSMRYTATDESGRILYLQTWPSSGSATEAWAIDPSAWAMDTNLAGPTVFQPLLFAGQYSDPETAVYNNSQVLYEPGVAVNGFRAYDPFVGAFLQPDPRVDNTLTSYVYVHSDPVGRVDRNGLLEGVPSNGGNPGAGQCSLPQAGWGSQTGGDKDWPTNPFWGTTWTTMPGIPSADQSLAFNDCESSINWNPDPPAPPSTPYAPQFPGTYPGDPDLPLMQAGLCELANPSMWAQCNQDVLDCATQLQDSNPGVDVSKCLTVGCPNPDLLDKLNYCKEHLPCQDELGVCDATQRSCQGQQAPCDIICYLPVQQTNSNRNNTSTASTAAP